MHDILLKNSLMRFEFHEVPIIIVRKSLLNLPTRSEWRGYLSVVYVNFEQVVNICMGNTDVSGNISIR